MSPALLPCAALVPPWPWVEPVHQEAVVWGQVVLQWLWHQQFLRLPPPLRVGLQTSQVGRPWAEAVDPLVTDRVEERVGGFWVLGVEKQEKDHRKAGAAEKQVVRAEGP